MPNRAKKIAQQKLIWFAAHVLGLTLFLTSNLIFAATDKAPARRVCVPASDGKTWNCGTSDNPPEPSTAPLPKRQLAPPPFLANPEPNIAPSTVVENPPLGETDMVAAEANAASTNEPEPTPTAGSDADTASQVEIQPDPMSNTEDAPSPPPFLVAPESRAGIPSTIVARPEADGMVDLANTKDTPKETAPSKSNANPEVQSRTASSAKAANDAEAERAQVEARARAEAQARSDAAAQAETQARADAIAQANALARAQEEAAERARLAEQIRLETEARARSQAAVQVAPTTQPAMPTAGRQQWKDARQFLTLPSSATSLQLAHGESPTALHELATRLGLSDSDTYLIRMDRNGRPWWVLLHGVFDDANQARAKLNQLPRDAAMNSAWPRRVLPLQNELGAPKL